jgi:hypothetical protein
MIYKQHEAAFKNVSAYVITDATGERVATIAFKFAASGLRTTCYMHWLGSPMVRGSASGGGYDKASAAAWAASQTIKTGNAVNAAPDGEKMNAFIAFISAIKDQGRHWDQDLKAAGFNVLQAV